MDMSCGMTMYFHWDSSDDCVLFKTWKIDSTTRYTLTCFAMFLLCIVREFILYVSKYYEISTLSDKMVPTWPTVKKLQEAAAIHSVNDIGYDNDKKIGMIQKQQFGGPISLKLRMIDCALYGISLILGYCLMLIVMTFNTGLIMVIIAGYCCGRFIFHRKTQLLTKFARMGQNHGFQDSDHCHVRS